jgi:predicted Rossmann-fold nucleotide-binding protein
VIDPAALPMVLGMLNGWSLGTLCGREVHKLGGRSALVAIRLKVVGIMGSGEHAFANLSKAAGQAVAESGHHLLTGAGQGVMLAAARAFVQSGYRRGLSLGVVRAKALPTLDGSIRRWEAKRPPNDYIELPVNTHLPKSGDEGQDFYSRNHINVLTSDAVIVLPGGSGTKSECDLAIQYGRPTILFLGDYKLDGLTARDCRLRYGSRVKMATDRANLMVSLREILGS